MNNIYDEAINLFLQQGKKINGVYDLIVRGSSKNVKSCVPQWSDIDVSIIVKKINIQVCDQVRSLHEEIRKKFSFKVSMTLVTEIDFVSSRHHHGIKPLYYTLSLQNSSNNQAKTTLFKNNDIHELRYDCFYNIVYLIHSLRTEDMKRGPDLLALQEFCRQLLKSSHHFIRNSIFIKTGRFEEKINMKLFKSCFPNIDHSFLEKLKFFKKNWPHILENYESLLEIREYVLPIINEIYDQMVAYFSSLNYKIVLLSNNEDLPSDSHIKTNKDSFSYT